MTSLDDAMEEYMAYIVLSERRPFCYRDFLKFEVNGKEYDMGHGTFRNKISKLMKNGKVELSYYSSCAFYTLKGYKFGKPMTTDHTVVHNNPLYKLIQDLPFDKQSIHDIRLRFTVPDIWQIFSVNPNFYRNKKSHDITIPTWSKNNVLIRTIIHKTDTVSVTIGCSLQPIPLDVNGVIRFFNLLVRIEEKLQAILHNSIPINSPGKYNSVPEYTHWIVTMWHFGRDSLTEYAGEGISYSVETVGDILTRLYVKNFNGKNRIRIERQEYPGMTVEDTIQEKLEMNSNKQQYLGNGSNRH